MGVGDVGGRRGGEIVEYWRNGEEKKFWKWEGCDSGRGGFGAREVTITDD